MRIGSDNAAAVRSDVVLLAVKPMQVAEVLQEIRGELKAGAVLVSVAASVPTKFIEQHLASPVAVVRAMPNTPCAIGCGMTGIARGSHATAAHVELAKAMFEAVGRVVVLDEKHMDAVTGLSASGVAFVYIVLESLTEGGVKVGLPGDVATLLAAQTMQGAARTVLETGDHPALLKDGVTTPAAALSTASWSGRRQTSRDADQGGGEGHRAGQGADVRRGVTAFEYGQRGMDEMGDPCRSRDGRAGDSSLHAAGPGG